MNPDERTSKYYAEEFDLRLGELNDLFDRVYGPGKVRLTNPDDLGLRDLDQMARECLKQLARRKAASLA